MKDLQKINGIWLHMEVPDPPPPEPVSEEVMAYARKLHHARLGVGESCTQCIEIAKARLSLKATPEGWTDTDGLPPEEKQDDDDGD